MDNKYIVKIETSRVKEIYEELKTLKEIELIEGKTDPRIAEMRKKVIKGLGTKENSLVFLLYDSITNKGDYFTFSDGFNEGLEGKDLVRIELNRPLDIKLLEALADLINPPPNLSEKQDNL
ncbi:MAG: hypothetical protein K6T16_02180 [Candidatus Pacearchaeota archaeon]|nr:hypothetical protein [Candidatus Pacearchaeota archaeon]